MEVITSLIKYIWRITQKERIRQPLALVYASNGFLKNNRLLDTVVVLRVTAYFQVGLKMQSFTCHRTKWISTKWNHCMFLQVSVKCLDWEELINTTHILIWSEIKTHKYLRGFHLPMHLFDLSYLFSLKSNSVYIKIDSECSFQSLRYLGMMRSYNCFCPQPPPPKINKWWDHVYRQYPEQCTLQTTMEYFANAMNRWCHMLI